MTELERVAADARELDARLREELAAKRLKRFTLLVLTPHEIGVSKSKRTATTLVKTLRADDKKILLGLPLTKPSEVLGSLAQAPPAKQKYRDMLEKELARAREEKDWDVEFVTSFLSGRLRALEEALVARANKSRVSFDSVQAEATGIHMTRFFSDEVKALTRHDETKIALVCRLRVRDSPPPRMYGEDPEPERFKNKEAEETYPTWPNDASLTALVKRAGSVPTF